MGGNVTGLGNVLSGLLIGYIIILAIIPLVVCFFYGLFVGRIWGRKKIERASIPVIIFTAISIEYALHSLTFDLLGILLLLESIIFGFLGTKVGLFIIQSKVRQKKE